MPNSKGRISTFQLEYEPVVLEVSKCAASQPIHGIRTWCTGERLQGPITSDDNENIFFHLSDACQTRNHGKSVDELRVTPLKHTFKEAFIHGSSAWRVLRIAAHLISKLSANSWQTLTFRLLSYWLLPSPLLAAPSTKA